MSPSKEFYEELNSQIETNAEILAPFLSAQSPEYPREFFTEIVTGKNVKLYGVLKADSIYTGEGSLDIPINIANYHTENTEGSAIQRFASLNEPVLNFQNASQAYNLLDLKFNTKYKDLLLSTSQIGKSFYLTIHRVPDSWYQEPWRVIFFRPEREDLAKSARGLSQHIKDVLGWQINPLSYEETVKTSR